MDKHDTLLIACGTPENRAYLRSVLQQRYNLLEATNTQQAMLLLEQNIDCIASMLLDISKSDNINRELLKTSQFAELMDKIPVIIISRDDSPEMLSRAFDYGVADVIPLDYDPYAMLRRIETIVDLHLHKQHLETMVQEQADLLRHSNNAVVDALSSIIEYRSVESGQHILRIRHFTRILLEEVARSCPEYDLDDRSISIISSAAALHDIGKIAIPDSILMKPSRLTQEEREVMKSHSLTGCHILDTLSDVADREYLRYAHNICHYHHERWDGRGYPEGLAGDTIPICAQVVGLADAYDALTTKRVYKDAYSFSQAVNMILKGDCGVFSPKLLECFKHVTDKYEELARAYADGLSPKMEAFDTTLPGPKNNGSGDTVDRTQAKYFALVHYINGLLMEVDLNSDFFHLIYNPYPELSWLQEVSTFSDMIGLLNERVVDLQGREKMVDIFQNGIHQFIEQDLRRITHRLHFHSKQHPEGDCFEITLLRINPIDASRKTLAILCCRVRSGEHQAAESPIPTLRDSTCVCRNDEELTILRMGAHVPILAGYSREELNTQLDNCFLRLLFPEDREAVRRSIREQLIHGTTVETEFRVRCKDGSQRWFQNKGYLTLGADGQEQLHCSLTDISGARRAYDALQEKLRQYEIILAQTENVLFSWNIPSNRVTFSETWEKIFGYLPMSGNVMEALRDGSYFHPDDLPLLMDAVCRLENGSNYETAEVRIATTQGRYIWCRFRASAIRDAAERLCNVVGIIINIDAEKQAERVLQDRAERDSLTRLLNKTAGRKQAEEYLFRFPQGVNCTMLIIDLDNFKQINDQYGHLFGDAVLTRVAREIEKLFRNQDIVSRIGGDEFLVLMRGISDRELVESRCQRLLNILTNIFHGQQMDLPLSCSIGIALAPEHGTSYYALFNNADHALYQAKAKGKNTYCFYDHSSDNFPAQKGQVSAVGNAIDSDEEPDLAEDNIVRHAFQRLYASVDVERSVNDILAMMGKGMNVSRVYVFENTEDNRFCNNTFEWCNEGIAPEIWNLQNISYETDIPGYENNFDEQGIFYCPDIQDLPKKTYDIVAPQGIKSMLHCAIREGGVFRGYIGFDECVEKRLWTKEQIRMLAYFSEMLSLFLLKHREQERALIQADELRTILDNQNAWIYIIDPDTCQLKYLNEKARKMAPEAKTGSLCHMALMGKTKRCEGCPSVLVQQKKTDSSVVMDSKYGMEILAEATMIRWKGQDSCLMTCRKMPGKKQGQ